LRFLRDNRVLPGQPVGCRLGADVGVRRLHQPGIGGHEVAAALRLRNAGSEPLPLLGEETAHALVEPIDLRPAGHRHTGDDYLRHALWMPLGVGEAPRSTPLATAQHTALDPQWLESPLPVSTPVIHYFLQHL